MTNSGHFVYNGSMITSLYPNVFERHVTLDGVDWDLKHHLIITSEANVFIDAGLGPIGINALAQFADPSKPHWLIYTHHHFDHVWGAAALKFTRIIAASTFNQRLREDFAIALAYYKDLQEGTPACVLADTVIDQVTPMGDLVLIPAPGHTSDGLMIHVPNLGLLFTGDNLPDQGKGPLPELEDPVAYQSTLEAMIRTQAHTLIGAHDQAQPLSVVSTVLKALNYPDTIG